MPRTRNTKDAKREPSASTSASASGTSTSNSPSANITNRNTSVPSSFSSPNKNQSSSTSTTTATPTPSTAEAKSPSKQSTQQPPSKPSSTPTTTTSRNPTATPPPPTLPRNATNIVDISTYLWRDYQRTTPQRTKWLDAFLVFLVVVGVLQFAYCVIGGTYPYNAFLGGFAVTVGQFVLTVSLRMQTNKDNRAEFGGISDERAFADYIFGSLILQIFCINFIN